MQCYTDLLLGLTLEHIYLQIFGGVKSVLCVTWYIGSLLSYPVAEGWRQTTGVTVVWDLKG